VRMEAEHQGKSRLEIKAPSKNRIQWWVFIKALCLSKGWKDIILLLLQSVYFHTASRDSINVFTVCNLTDKDNATSYQLHQDGWRWLKKSVNST
jgi:hypothetical protein